MLYEHKVQYYETDQMKIVHHSNYIRWFEEARVYMLEKMGLPYNELEKRGIICPVLSIDIEYKSMSRFGESVIIDAKPVSYKGVRFSIEYIVRDKASGEIRCLGKSSHCFVDEGSKPVSLKKTQPDIHEAFLTSIEKENA